MWRCRTGAAGDCRAAQCAGWLFRRTWSPLGPQAFLNHRGRLQLEPFATGDVGRVEPAVFAPVNGDGHDRLAVLGAAQLGGAVQPFAQAMTQNLGAVFDGDLHACAAAWAMTRRGGSIMCQRATLSFGRMNSKVWLSDRIRRTFPPATEPPVASSVS